MSDPLSKLADLAGVVAEYRDTTKVDHPTSEETKRALLGAMGYDVSTTNAVKSSLAEEVSKRKDRLLDDWMVLDTGAESRPLPPELETMPWVLKLEDGHELEGRGSLPALPLGIHRIEIDGQDTAVISAPKALPLPEQGWGVTVPLYGLRSSEEGGLGDFSDLSHTVSTLGSLGAGFVGINPIHMGFPGDPEARSPYTPSHRRRLNPVYLPNAAEQTGRGVDLIDYDVSVSTRFSDLELAYAQANSDQNPGFAAYLKTEGKSLERFSLHQAISEKHGPYWNTWPNKLQDPESAAVQSFACAHQDRTRFHAWLQWRAHCALKDVAETANTAGMRHGLYLDLAVGTHPFGAETWSEREQFASGVSLGAPPDAFSPSGQTWQLAPFNPRTMARDGFSVLADTLRAQLKYAGLLRIDHVLGFARAFWIPFDSGVAGGYVKMPETAMLAVARLEAARAGAVIVGEDLGNVPSGFCEKLGASGILGCRVVQFEQKAKTFTPSDKYDPATLASFGTHDLPTWAGWRQGADISCRRELGLIEADQAALAQADRAEQVASLDTALGGRSHETFLANCKSKLVALQIEDLLRVEKQPNLPGTVDEYPNWRRRLPVSIDTLVNHPAVIEAASVMKKNGR